jgi:hypothetical protein
LTSFQNENRAARAFEPQDTLNLVAAVNDFFLIYTYVNCFEVLHSIFADSEVNKFPVALKSCSLEITFSELFGTVL